MITQSDFNPPAWFRNPHLQTLWAYAVHSRVSVNVRRERLELPDGDFIDLDWNSCKYGPIVVVLHGLSGSVNSHYAKTTLLALQRCGMRGVLMNFRGASGEPNRLARGYHGGETGDLSTIIGILQHREQETPIAVVGFSLGGNVLLKWLGEQGERCPAVAAVTVSAPLDLDRTTERLNRGFSRIYQWHILNCLKREVYAKSRTVDLPVEVDKLRTVSSFRQFDDLITAPLHGFGDAAEYYASCSARRFLGTIARPTLILHSLDDPFIPPSVLPRHEELSAHTTVELSRHGGHVGFVDDATAVSGGWMDKRITDFLQRHLGEWAAAEDCVIPFEATAGTTVKP